MPASRIEFLDGLRGIAALYVVLFHVVHLLERERLSPLGAGAPLTPWMRSFGVTVLVVVSGFALMLPVARGGPAVMTTAAEIVGYLRRRARRILPPYYAALVASLGFATLASHVGLPGPGLASTWDVGSVVSHLFLVHNVSEFWAWRINAPLWALATIWQIYFMFPAVLLPVWRRFGNAATIAAGFLLGLLPLFLLSHHGNWDWAKPWLLGDFALGMAGAAIVCTDSRESRALLDRTPWTALCLAFLAGTVGAIALLDENIWIADILRGATSICLILALARRSAQARARPTLPIRMLTSRAAMALGAFSYSLYLVHFPILEQAVRLLRDRHVGAGTAAAISFLVVVPCVLAVAYAFHLIFERPAIERRLVARIVAAG
jgi:peptidoglycan/LPS O-acetylase OafA/YrhL